MKRKLRVSPPIRKKLQDTCAPPSRGALLHNYTSQCDHFGHSPMTHPPATGPRCKLVETVVDPATEPRPCSMEAVAEQPDIPDVGSIDQHLVSISTARRLDRLGGLLATAVSCQVRAYPEFGNRQVWVSGLNRPTCTELSTQHSSPRTTQGSKAARVSRKQDGTWTRPN